MTSLPLERPKVLVADDQPMMLKILEREVRPSFEPVLANGGIAALESFERHRMSYALLDVQMPDVNGLEVARRILEATPESIVILVSACFVSATPQELKRTVPDGVFACVAKPFRPGHLVELLQWGRGWLHDETSAPATTPIFVDSGA